MMLTTTMTMTTMTTMTTTMMRRMTRSSSRSLGRVVGIVDVGHVGGRGVPRTPARHLSSSSASSSRKVPFSSLVAEQLAAAKEQHQPLDVHSLLPDEYTAGHVLAVLNQVAKGGYKQGSTISEDHIRLLLSSARPDVPQDAKIILKALIDYKRINRFLLTSELAADCIETILRCDPITGGLLVLEHFTIESGFYFSASIETINRTLHHILHHPSDDTIDDHPARLWKALVQTTDQLLYRKSRPYHAMKKRAKRAYLFQCRTHEGPNDATVHLLVELGMAVTTTTTTGTTDASTATTGATISTANAEAVYQDLVQPCLDQRVSISEELLVSLNTSRLLQAADEHDYHEDHPDLPSTTDMDTTTTTTSGTDTATTPATPTTTTTTGTSTTSSS